MPSDEEWKHLMGTSNFALQFEYKDDETKLLWSAKTEAHTKSDVLQEAFLY